MDINKKIAEELEIKVWQVEAVVKLVDEGNTIPFIARYRKEQHGALNDEQLRNLHERLIYLRNPRFLQHRHRLSWMICIVHIVRNAVLVRRLPKKKDWKDLLILSCFR